MLCPSLTVSNKLDVDVRIFVTRLSKPMAVLCQSMTRLSIDICRDWAVYNRNGRGKVVNKSISRESLEQTDKSRRQQ